MAHIVITYKDGTNQKYDIYKRITTLGSKEDADIVIKDKTLPLLMAYISQSHNKFSLVTAEGAIKAKFNEQIISKHDFVDQDVIFIKDIKIQFFTHEEKVKLDHYDEVMAYRKIVAFSERIAKEKDIENLLAILLLEITQITKAEYGFLVLLKDGKPQIKELPNFAKMSMGTFSDSIVKKVIDHKKPVIINDALNDHEFSLSMSVINYRLTSVMCVPLIYQGQTLGAIYVGNNSFTNAFNEKSLDLMMVYATQAALLVQNALYINSLKMNTIKLQETLDLSKFGAMIGSCTSMQEIFTKLDKIAHADVNILLIGEAGTGKKLIAREIHERSSRKNHKFEIINCASIPADILANELFGYLRGSFLGATQSKIGKIQEANNGILFLDEIEHLPLHIQINLLEALKEQNVIRLGSLKKEPINIRVIASSSENLFTMIKKNEFSNDLFYILNSVSLTIPPLRERGNDVLVIANFFLQKYQKIYGKEIIGFSEQSCNALLNYNWPGNVRQLDNRIKRAVVMCDSNRISPIDLDLGEVNAERVLPLADALEQFRYRYISESLKRNAHNRTKAALELGVDPRTIFRFIKKAEEECR